MAIGDGLLVGELKLVSEGAADDGSEGLTGERERENDLAREESISGQGLTFDGHDLESQAGFGFRGEDD